MEHTTTAVEQTAAPPCRSARQGNGSRNSKILRFFFLWQSMVKFRKSAFITL
jgi:hypothetical protein